MRLMKEITLPQNNFNRLKQFLKNKTPLIFLLALFITGTTFSAGSSDFEYILPGTSEIKNEQEKIDYLDRHGFPEDYAISLQLACGKTTAKVVSLITFKVEPIAKYQYIEILEKGRRTSYFSFDYLKSNEGGAFIRKLACYKGKLRDKYLVVAHAEIDGGSGGNCYKCSFDVAINQKHKIEFDSFKNNKKIDGLLRGYNLVSSKQISLYPLYLLK